MTTGRVTQRMLTESSLHYLQNGLGRLARVQEQLSTGRVLNRPSDDPADTTAAMRLRSSIAHQQQYARNAEDGLGWLAQVDATLGTVTDSVRRARELALQGASSGTAGATAREALATEVEEIRDGVLSLANATYLGRPVFGGVVGAGGTAYDATGTYVGLPGDVERRVADGVTVQVDVDGRTVFGDGAASVFAELDGLATALRAGDAAGITTSLDALAARLDTVLAARTAAGTRYDRLERAALAATDAAQSLTGSLAEIENTDLPRAVVDLQLQEVAYQAALSATQRVLQPSLLDFLR
ncbi:flagellar hook-associated protein FlgL [Nocardioides sp. TF02-7]|uniref:flagellar hook-associated protein FlgL n=1 Tax=Nocardioides sp. TF02-7 TaxID=2917724 RepID=UPI001F06C631|nr:flagellar hook-associated protein FlgL [Nocardioides sp. TF02-7]UMG92944.1 flagellar hook-associated protein FlgL [Nocardioides sp. TF02-7]